MKPIIPIAFLILCILGLILIFVWFFSKNAKDAINFENVKSVSINGKKVDVEVAISPMEKAKGLMFREYLAENAGMLFVFQDSAKHAFWMANTKIPLDIIWIDKNFKIVDISKNTPPCTETGNLIAYCKSYPPKENALYVLETNGGWTTKNNIKIGDILEF